jgi:hypothetical protein
MEQWKQDLIDHPPKSARAFTTEEWHNIVINELEERVPSVSEFKVGHVHSIETKAKLALAQRKRKGTYSKETKERISKSNTGKKRSAISREKMRLKALGRVLSKATKNKIRDTLTGIKRSPEFKAKLALAVKGRIHVTDGVINKFVKPHEIPAGFIRGRTL